MVVLLKYTIPGALKSMGEVLDTDGACLCGIVERLLAEPFVDSRQFEKPTHSTMGRISKSSHVDLAPIVIMGGKLLPTRLIHLAHAQYRLAPLFRYR